MSGDTVAAGSIDAIGREIVALYREARSAASADFKSWAMARAKRLLPLHSTHWINGVMTARRPVFHHVGTEGMRPGYWEHYQTLMAIDPLGPRMFASPGSSFVVGYDDVPPPIRDEIMIAFDVRHAVQGMAADPTTGTFSVVCWHRDPTLPPFTEAERQLHEQLLPHWVECLNLHRVGSALRDLSAAVVPGSLVALVESTGLIHYAQLGFGELIGEEFADWTGACLPEPLLASLHSGDAGHEGARLSARWRPVQQQLWMVHVRPRAETHLGAYGQAREAEVRLLNASLDERERELEAARRQLHEREKREAVLQERERILRELHDGVGAHLVGLRSLLRAGSAVTDDMAQALDGALDEMRLAVDSMHAVEGDLGERLAALRWRLQPRLEAAGIDVRWSMPDSAATAAACAGLSANAALQVQRLLLEAFTNILKHARATVVMVSFEVRAGAGRGWSLRISDNGVGLPPPAATAGARPGIGLQNMARRAASIGALLHVGSGSTGEAGDPPGTHLQLVWPAPPQT